MPIKETCVVCLLIVIGLGVVTGPEHIERERLKEWSRISDRLLSVGMGDGGRRETAMPMR